MVFEWTVAGFNQTSARLFAIPPSLGVEFRILNGYVYDSPTSVTDDATLAPRTELFRERGGYYYEHWHELYDSWVEKVEAETRSLRALDVPALPEYEDESIVTAGRGFGTSHLLLAAYDRLLEGLDRVLHYHFELLNLGYGATSRSTNSAGACSRGSRTARWRAWSPDRRSRPTPGRRAQTAGGLRARAGIELVRGTQPRPSSRRPRG
jgi:hypothetical protein